MRSSSARAQLGAKHRRFSWLSGSAPAGRRRPRLALAGAVAAAIVTAALLVGMPAVQKVIERPFGGSAAEGPVFPGPEPARAETAAEVVRIVEEALRTARTITGDYGQWIGRPGDEPRFDYDIHVVFAADGSRWVTANHKTDCWELTYDADTGVKRVWFGEFGPAPSVRIVTEEYSGMPPGEPDGGDSRALFDHPTPGGMGWELYGAIAHVARSNPDGKVGTGNVRRQAGVDRDVPGHAARPAKPPRAARRAALQTRPSTSSPSVSTSRPACRCASRLGSTAG